MFKGNRWQELVEIQALEQAAGKLVMKYQVGEVASSGYSTRSNRAGV